jgi:glycosyltransferase involved in cell wall biosynthesis
MNILVISHYAGSPSHGMAFRPYYLGREWVRMGHDVTIVASSFSHLRSHQPDTRGRITEEELDGIRYRWYRCPEYEGNGAGRARNVLSFVRQVWFDSPRLASRFRPDLVIASSTYPFDVLPAARIVKATSATFVHEVHDLWPLTLVELMNQSERNPFIVTMQWAEEYGYRNADYVVALLPKADEHMRRHGMDAAKFRHIPNGVVLSEWTADPGPLPEEHRAVLDRIHEQGRFAVCYLGGHTATDTLDTLLDASAQLEDRNVSTVLVGQGPEKEQLQRHAETLGLRHTYFLPHVHKHLVPAVLSEVDACYIGWRRSPIYRFGVCPNKLMDYMMAGKPVIHAIEAGNNLVDEARCGVNVSPDDAGAIVSAVEELTGLSEEERRSMGQRGRAYVTEHHDYSVLAARFLALVGNE